MPHFIGALQQHFMSVVWLCLSVSYAQYQFATVDNVYDVIFYSKRTIMAHIHSSHTLQLQIRLRYGFYGKQRRRTVVIYKCAPITSYIVKSF